MQKVEIHWIESGGFVLITPQKCLEIPTLETTISEVRSFFRQDNSEHKTQEPCPYCSSTDTIGHGLWETGKQVLTGRFCKVCNKTWVSGREQKIAASTKEQVAFLKLLDYSEKDITELVHRSKSAVRAHIENIETADWQAKKQAEAQIPTEAVVKAGAEKPDTTPILAPEFNRAQALKERIGNFTVWDYNGRLAASEKGKQEVIYLTKDSILHMKMLRRGRQGKQKLSEYLSQLPEAHRQVVGELIETLIDSDLGMFPMLRISTKVGNEEINADDYEDGRFG